MTKIAAALDRQEQIWAALGANTAVLAAIDAGLHDEDDLDEAGTMRPI